MNRPLAWVAAGLAAGVWLAGTGWLPAPWGAALPLLLGILLPFGLPPTVPREGVRALLLAAALGVFLHHLRPPAAPDDDDLFLRARAEPGRTITVEGVVRAAPVILPGLEHARLVVDVTGIRAGDAFTPARGRALLRWSEPTGPLYPGDPIHARGRLQPRLGPVNHGVRGYEDHLRGRGIHTRIDARGGDVRAPGGAAAWSPARWAARLREWEARALARHVPAHTLPFLMTVWLGDRGGLGREAYDQAVSAGTAHVLTVSGVHVGIVFASLQMILPLLVRRRDVRAALCLLGVFAFALAAGAGVSVTRAAFMAGIYIAADLAGRERDGPTALSIAAIVFLIARPPILFDISFVLSFGSVASILLFSDGLGRRFRRMPAPLAQALGTTVGVQVLPLPMTLHYFHVLPMLGVIANLVVVPILGAVLWLCFATILLAGVFPPAALLMGHACAALVDLILLINETLHTTLRAARQLPSPGAFAAAAYGAGALALARALDAPRPRRAAALAAACLAVSLATWTPWRDPARMDVLDVGHGDAIFVRTPEGATLLMDGGDASGYTDLGASVVVPYLLSHGVRHLDVVAVSHPDRDHIGGLFRVLDRLSVGAVVLGGEAGGAELEARFLGLCAARGVPVRRVAAGDTIPLPGALVEALHPPARTPNAWSVNDRSLVLRVSWPGFAALLTGDIEMAAEWSLVREDCRAALLKVPHHGSHTSSSSALLDAVAPTAALVSTVASGQRQAIGRGVAERYAERGIPLWRTDLHGGLRVTPDPGGWRVEAARAARGSLLAPAP